MELIEIYTEYKYLNESFTLFVDDLINNNFEGHTEHDIVCKLIAAKENYGRLKEEADKIELEEECDEGNVKDLEYLLVDGLFLAIDLLNFYRAKEFERFKMRGTNYIRKGRVLNFFK